MFIEEMESTAFTLIRENSESFNATLPAWELQGLIEKMKERPSWEKGVLNSMILINNQSSQVVLIIMHEGTEIISSQANDSITFRVLEGKLILHIRKGSLTLQKGEVLTLYEKTKYSIKSMGETSFLLTLTS